MRIKTSRRTFLGQTILAGVSGPFIITSKTRAQNRQKLRHASIGVGGQRGGHDLGNFATHPDIEIVALCDVDARFLEGQSEIIPNERL